MHSRSIEPTRSTARIRGRRYSRLAIPAALVVIALCVLPSTAWAWTPGTHIFLGEAVLAALGQLPKAIAELLGNYPVEFLYGSIAADTSIAKKYAPVGRHCHSWAVGLEIYDKARDDALKSFALGYLAHLAADTVAHNFFVPRYLIIASRTTGVGHSYWESRFETHLGQGYSRRAREVILRDHSRSDDHLDRILSPTIFSTQTNRRLFRGMVYVTDTESWQRIFQLAAENSRWDLTDPDVARYMERSYDFIIDFLRRVDYSEPYALDPAGDDALRLAKEVRRDSRKAGMEFRMAEEATRQFAMPESQLRFASELGAPLYSPAAARADKI
ncbi:MAG: zinc dependent phospholipase C family protein [Gemmatimonadota bacterium]|nr:zinc dependent phospholipase C family protein [Gemmatimonadota bacterium]